MAEPDLLRILEINEAVCRQKHNALWEEQKHFTWWVSVIFPVLVVTFFNADLAPRSSGDVA